ncbi:MAG: nucleoside deaminase [Candidatus Rokuibacteriota bacterium]|nr:MAG: nucleoside deaminase [Candidatus Rokubacteria bacterium]
MESRQSRLVIDVPAWVDAVTASGQTYRRDEDKMALVIRLAEENVARRAGGPFAAAVLEIESGRVVAAGVNSVVRQRNSALHAEMLALMLGQQRVGSFTLRAPGRPAHELVTSCEPCAMCLGATLWSGVSRLVIGAERGDAMAVGFDEGPVFPESYAYLAERGVEAVWGVRRAEAANLLRAYRDGGGFVYNPDAGPPTAGD